MRIRVKNLDVRTIMDKALNRNSPIDIRYEVQVKFSPDDLQDMHNMRGMKTEEIIDAIGEGIKSEMKRINELNKKKNI